MSSAGSDLLQCLPELRYRSKHSEPERVPASRHRASHAVQLNPDIQLALDIAREQLPRRITNLPPTSSDEMLPLVKETRQHATTAVSASGTRTPKPIARHPFALRVERDCLRDSSAPHDTRTRVIAPQRSLDFRPSHTFDSDSSVDEKHGADADEEDSEHRFNDDNDDAIFPYARDYPPVQPRPVINGPFASLIGTLEGIPDDSHNAAESLEQSDLSSDEDNVYQHRRLANFRMPSVLERSEQPTPMPSSSTGASTPRAVPTPRSFGRRKSTAIQPPELDISGWSLVPSPGSEEASLLSWPAAAVLPSGYDASPTTPMFAYSVPLESTSASRRRTNSVSSTRSGKSSRLSAVFNRLRPGSAPAPSLASPTHLSPTD